MATLIMTVGISGSGKTHLRNKLLAHFGRKIEAVCPDDLRDHILGNINDQSSGDMIFTLVEQITKVALKNIGTVYLDATSLSIKSWKQFKLKVENYLGKTFNYLVVLMDDSMNLNLCKQRIKNDIENFKNRANIPEDVSDKQFNRYNSVIKFISDNSEIFSDYNIIHYHDNFSELVEIIEECMSND
jgi:predicted kinase